MPRIMFSENYSLGFICSSESPSKFTLMSKAYVYLHFKQLKISSRCYIYLDPCILILVQCHFGLQNTTPC